MSTGQDDDFEDVLKAGHSIAPCTVSCGAYGGRGKVRGKRLSVAFRCDGLPAEVVALLQGPRYAVAYSSKTRTLRLTVDPLGQYELARAPNGRGQGPSNTWMVRVPHTDKMPWFEKRVVASVDLNEVQKAVFVELPDDGVAKPAAGGQLRLPAPVAESSKVQPLPRITMLGGVTLPHQQEVLLNALLKYEEGMSKPLISVMLREEGYDPSSANAVVSALKRTLDASGLTLSESANKTSVWLHQTTLNALMGRYAA